MKKNKHIGSSFDEFLQEEGILVEAEAAASRRVMEKSRLRKLYWVIEINCLLWVGVLVLVIRSEAGDFIKRAVFVLFVLSALLQHWAYYNVYKKHLKKPKGM
ncbi:MAG: hypothetical protein P8123_08080 [bacterium]